MADEKNIQQDAENKPQNEGHKPQTGTDPQEAMKGPLSSFMHKAGHSFDTKETREEAEKEHREKW